MAAGPVPSVALSKILPPLIFGTGTFNIQHNKDPFALDTVGLIQKALSHGIRAFDTSPYYGPAEELLGDALNTPYVRNNYPRSDCFFLTKVGRIGDSEFDYSPAWIRYSIERSIKRLHTKYLDVVYCHDAEFVSPEEVLAAVKELRRIRTEKEQIRYIGISGYPLEVLCELAEMVLRETGEPLDAVQSYAHYTVQNMTLVSTGLDRLKAAGVDVVLNASPLGMGLLRRDGPPIGQIDFHPASKDLRTAIMKASEFCDSHGEPLEVVSIRFALESWVTAGSSVGSTGDPASGVPWRQETNGEVGGKRLGVSVIGWSRVKELEKTMSIWRSILDGLEDGQKTADAAGRWRKNHEWSVCRKKTVQLLAEGIQETLGDWVDYDWPCPPPGYIRSVVGKPSHSIAVPFPTPAATPESGTPEPFDQFAGQAGIPIR